VMTDNAFGYVHSRAFKAVLGELGVRPPYTPRWNGKVERLIQTLDDEWAPGQIWATSAQRDRGLASLAALLQPPQTPHLAPGPATPQPRSQRPWARQLAGGCLASPRRGAPPRCWCRCRADTLDLNVLA
jgi:hypothetical protein